LKSGKEGATGERKPQPNNLRKRDERVEGLQATGSKTASTSWKGQDTSEERTGRLGREDMRP